MKEYLTIKEILDATGKSDSYIRGLLRDAKDSAEEDAIRKNGKVLEVELSFIAQLVGMAPGQLLKAKEEGSNDESRVQELLREIENLKKDKEMLQKNQELLEHYKSSLENDKQMLMSLLKEKEKTMQLEKLSKLQLTEKQLQKLIDSAKTIDIDDLGDDS